MVSFVDAARNAVKQAACFVIGQSALSAQWAANLSPYFFPSGVKQSFEAFDCTQCGRCGGDNFPPGPFTGGQCSSTLYRASGQLKWDVFIGSTGNTVNVDEFVQTNLIFTGPITSVVTRQITSRSFDIQITDAIGTTSNFFRQNPISTNSISNARFEGGFIDATNSPGACGDPPPELPPPQPINVDVDIEFNVDEGPTITIPFGIIFAPVNVDLDGTVKIPVTLNGPLFEFSGDINLDPEFGIDLEFNFDGMGGGGAADDPQIGPGAPGFDGENVEVGPDPTIVGVVVRSTPTGGDRNTLIGHTVGPDILAPGVATVRFAIATGQIVSWTSDQRVKGVNEFVPVPVPWGAVSFSVESETGWQHQATAIRAKPLQSFS